MQEVYSLKNDPERVKKFAGIHSISDDIRQVDFPHGSLGSDEWWKAVERGDEKIRSISGMILRFEKKTGKPGSHDGLVMRIDAGRIIRWQAFTNEADAGALFFRPGRGVKVSYAKLKVREGAEFPVNQVVKIEVDNFVQPKLDGALDKMKCVFSAADFPNFESIFEKTETPFGSVGSPSWWEATLNGKFKLTKTRGFVVGYEPEEIGSGAKITVHDEKGGAHTFRAFTTDGGEPKETYLPGRRIQLLWFDMSPYSEELKGVTVVVFIDVYV